MVAHYRCRIADARGRISTVTVQADGEELAMRAAGGGGRFVVSVEPVRTRRLRGEAGRHRRRLADRHLLDLTRMLATLLDGGVLLPEALAICGESFPRPPLADVVRELTAQVERGGSLAGAVAASRFAFPPVYAGVCRVGERSADLAGALARLATYLDNRRTVRGRLVTALMYPAFVLCAAGAAIVVIATVVLPRLAGIFAQLGETSVSLARALRGARLAGGAALVTVAALLVIGVVLVVVRRRSSAAAAGFDALRLAVPGLGVLFESRDLLTLTFAMQALLGSGVSLADAITAALPVADNLAIRSAMERARDRLIAGGDLSAALSEERVIPDVLVRWVRIGERTGDLTRTLGDAAEYFRRRLQRWTERFVVVIEPVVIIGVAVVVLVVVLTFVVPVFSLYGSV